MTPTQRTVVALILVATLHGCASGTSSGTQSCILADGCAGEVVVGDEDAGPNGGLGFGGGSGARAPSNIPCEVEQVLVEACQLCHGDPPTFGAPSSLASQADFLAASFGDMSRNLAAVALERIQHPDASRRMPPAGQLPLNGEQLRVLGGWLEAGSPTGEGCAPAELPLDAGAGDPAMQRAGNIECYRLLAHASGDRGVPYPVGLAYDSYINFTFRVPWEGEVYATEMNAVVDNEAGLHHWLLYKNFVDVSGDSIAVSTGAHPEGELMVAWAPGAADLRFDRWGDVGYVMAEDVSYTLEIHYNSSDEMATDASGVEICVTRERPESIATLSWLGTDAIIGFSAGSTCAPGGSEPIHILSWMPHMHKAGTHLQAIINRQDGTKETMHDADFDFDYQTTYYGDIVLMPGDTISTTCTYSTFSTFGESTDAEMCYLFTTAYPAGALRDIGPIGAGTHGGNTCLGI